MRGALIGGAFSALVIVALAGCSDDTAEPPATLDPANVEHALITLDDLPEAYRVADPGDADRPPSVCAPDLPRGAAAQATAEFENRPGLSLVEHAVSLYDDADAIAALDAVRRAFTECREPGVTIEERDVDDAGDDVVGYRLTLTENALPLTTDVTYFRSGDVVVGIATASVVGPPSAALDAELLDAAEERLELAIEG
jgi:hypothetical protein